MKNQTITNRIIRLSLALALALAIWSPVQARSAEPAPAEGKNMTESQMMERCQEMKEKKQKIMAETKAQDDELTEQVAKMNSAPKDKKLDLLAAVVTRMVEQRIARKAQMAKMHEEMMNHMMEHMQMGKEFMSHCLMMKGMDEKSGDAPKKQK